MSDGVGSNLVSKSVHILDSGVVGVVMGHEECGFDITTIGISPLLVEDFLVEINISNVDGVIECECDHLWDPGAPVILGTQVSGHLSSVLGAETVGQTTQSLVTLGSTVWVSVGIYDRNICD